MTTIPDSFPGIEPARSYRVNTPRPARPQHIRNLGDIDAVARAIVEGGSIDADERRLTSLIASALAGQPLSLAFMSALSFGITFCSLAFGIPH
jgi:hypothetical protein